MKFMSLFLLSFTLLVSNAWADVDLTRVFEIKVKDAAGLSMPLWRYQLLGMTKVKKISVDEKMSASFEMFDFSGLKVDFSMEDMSKQLLSSAEAQENINFVKNGKQLFKNFDLLKDPSEFPLKNDGKIRIYVAGADWCMWCKPTAGSMLRLFSNLKDIEIVYLDLTIASKTSKRSSGNSSVESNYILDKAVKAGALLENYGYPSIVIEKSGNLVSVSEQDKIMSQLLATRATKR